MQTESSQSQENSWPSSILDSQIDTSYEELQSIEESVNNDKGQRFDGATVGNETFCLFPKDTAKYVPAYLTKKEILEGVGEVDVGSTFMYVPSDLVSQLQTIVEQSTNLQMEVKCCSEYLWFVYGKHDRMPPFDPDSLREASISAGATTLFDVILDDMSGEGRSAKQQEKNKKKTVTIVYMLMFGQSQKASWFQTVMSNMVVKQVITEGGLSVLNQSGIAITKSTQCRLITKIAELHELIVREFVADAIDKNALLVLMIDEFTNIHTKRRPSDQTTSTARNMATSLVQQFDDGPAIPVHKDTINLGGICKDKLLQFSQNIFSCFSKAFAISMPYWIRAASFDPEMERSRIEIHNYQEHLTGTQCMRKMTGCKLLDDLEIPLKKL